jgi:hypothetical protein
MMKLGARAAFVQALALTLANISIAAAEDFAAYKWGNPFASQPGLVRRQAGYHPEFGGCDTGTTCSDACGKGFEECESSTNLALFCYNPTVGQTCCRDDLGREFLHPLHFQ